MKFYMMAVNCLKITAKSTTVQTMITNGMYEDEAWAKMDAYHTAEERLKEPDREDWIIELPTVCEISEGMIRIAYAELERQKGKGEGE